MAITNTSTELDWRVDLTSLVPTPIPEGESLITIDWSQMTTNGLGGTFRTSAVGTLAIGRYEDTPGELEDRFLDLVRFDGSVVADDLWLLEVPAGEEISLSMAVDETGSRFPGIDDTGTWVLALLCLDCRNPAPWYLTTLVPCE